jgi:hypothetical protein
MVRDFCISGTDSSVIESVFGLPCASLSHFDSMIAMGLQSESSNSEEISLQ